MTIPAATKTEDDPPQEPAEREVAWHRAIAAKDYGTAARIARVPLPLGASKDEHRKWNLRKFVVREFSEDPEDVGVAV